MERRRVARTWGEAGPYVVACAGPRRDRAAVAVTAPSCAQAWEALCIHLRARAADPELASAGYEAALADLEGQGPSPLGWWAEVGGEEVWYGPGGSDPARRGLTAGEQALLDALAAPPRWPAAIRQ